LKGLNFVSVEIQLAMCQLMNSELGLLVWLGVMWSLARECVRCVEYIWNTVNQAQKCLDNFLRACGINEIYFHRKCLCSLSYIKCMAARSLMNFFEDKRGYKASFWDPNVNEVSPFEEVCEVHVNVYFTVKLRLHPLNFCFPWIYAINIWSLLKSCKISVKISLNLCILTFAFSTIVHLNFEVLTVETPVIFSRFHTWSCWLSSVMIGPAN